MSQPARPPLQRILDDIRVERHRQDMKWGDQSAHPDGFMLAILLEEEPLGEPRRDGHGDRRRPSTAGQLTDEPLRLPLGGEPGGPLSAALTPRHAPLFRLAGPVSMDARHDPKGSPDSGECCPIRCPKRPPGRRGTPKTAWTSSGGYRDRTGGLLLAKQTGGTVGPCNSRSFPAPLQGEHHPARTRNHSRPVARNVVHQGGQA